MKIPYKTEPWSHQRRDVDRINREHIKSFALFYDMGAGKTKTAIDIARGIYCRHNRVVKTLIICPIAVVEQWKEEFQVHSNVPITTIQIVDGKTKLNGKKLKNAQLKLKIEQACNSDCDIFIINTEAVKYLTEYSYKKVNGKSKRIKNNNTKEVWHHIEQLGVELLIVDESHRFKTHNAKRTKGLHQLTRQPQLTYRYILTGSPVLQDAQDLWSQFYILDPNILGPNFFEFRARYFYDVNADMPAHNHFPNWVPKDAAYYKKYEVPFQDDTAMLNEIIYRHASRVMKSEVLDLPPYMTKNIIVEMESGQARIYKEMKDDLVAILDDTKPNFVSDDMDLIDAMAESLEDNDVMTADLAIVKTLRLMQITAGIFTNEQGENIVLKTNIEKQLRELLEAICSNRENKVIVWSIFKPTYEVIGNICTELGIKFVYYNGLMDKDEKEAAKKSFNNDKEVQVIIANQAAGGTGVNLTAANYDIYYTWDFSLEKFLQSAARAYRGGQTRSYTSYKLVTADTIAEASLKRLEEKFENAENILDNKKEFSKRDILNMI